MTDPTTEPLPRRVSLGVYGWISHYSLSLYLSAISIVCLYFATVDGPGQRRHDPNLLWVAVPASVVAYGFAWIRTRSLGFTILKTADGAADNYRKILEVMVEQDWRVREFRDGEMISAQVRAPWSDLTWGELITVRMHGSYVALNCVGDPYSGPSGSRTDSSRAKLEKDLVVGALRII